MNFRTRHIAIALYGAIGFTAIVAKPELFASIQDIMLVLAPLIGMFTWDKIAGGSIRAPPK